MSDYIALIAKYFPANQVQNAIAVMNGESGGDAAAHNTNGEDSRGLFQINVSPAANPDLAKYNLFDPETNIRIAAQMQKERGWQPWTAAQKLGITDNITDNSSPDGGLNMPPPETVEKQRRPYWLSKDSKGKTVISYKPTGGFGQIGDRWILPPNNEPDGYEVTYDNGEVWDYPADNSEPAPINSVAKQADRYRVDQGLKGPSDFTLGKNSSRWTVDPETGQPVMTASGVGGQLTSQKDMYIGTDINGNPIKNPEFDWQNYDKEQRLLDADIAYKNRLASGISTAQPRTAFPWEEKKGWLDVEKAQRDLMNPYLLQQQQIGEVITSIQGQLARGEIDMPTANGLMALARQNTAAALRGTTPFQIDQQRQTLARQVTSDNMSANTKMAANLLSGLGGIYGKILGNTNPPALDPLAMAQGFVNQTGPGPQINDLAKSLLMGALQPQQQQGGF